MIKSFYSLLLALVSASAFSQAFITTWNTANPGTSANNVITIPTNPAYTNYNYTVDWGDGTTTSNATGNRAHTYAAPGVYTVSITGTFPAIFFNNMGDRRKITSILSWGAIQWQSMEDAFYGCENLNFDAIDSPNLAQVTSLKNMFRDCTSFNGILNNWNVSTITNISGIFAKAEIFNRPLNTWNTIAITDMSETFSGANNFNEPLDNWNTASVTNMKDMFYACVIFNQNINNWDVSQVTDMSGMFVACRRFNQPLNTWNVSQVTDMNLMFFRTNDFNQNLNNWQVGNVTNMFRMFHESAISHPMNNWDVSKVTNMSQMFADTPNFNQPINSWDVSKVTNMSQMFEGTRVFNQPLADWDVSSVTNMSGMFKGDYLGMIYNQPLDTWNVSNVTNMSEMFEKCNAFNQPLSSWNVSNVLNMSRMFFETAVFNQSLDNWNVGKVTNLSGMFQSAVQFNQPLTGWNTTLVTNMNGIFQNATSFNQNLASWNVTGATNMANMLSNSGLSQANYDNALISWASQNVKNNVSLGALNLNYCDGLTARQALITSKNWNITGDIINCPFVLCTTIISPFNGDQNVPANSSIRWNATPNATGYRVSIRREDDAGNLLQVIANNQDFGNVVLLNFTNEFLVGDNVFVTVVPYNDDGPAVGCQEISFKTVASWVNSPDAFKITIDTRNLNTSSSASNQFRLNLNKGFPDNLIYDFSVDWGDNQYNNNVTNDITHTYLIPGIYTISIIGNYPAHYNADTYRDNFKLLSIDQWGTQQWRSMKNAFYYCENMVYNATDIPNLSQVTSMQNTFHRAFKFNGNINNWDVSNVTDMTGVFFQASLFNQPLDNWNVSKVTEMNGMFYATPFNQPLTSWDVSNVNKMQDLFNNARVFNQPLNNWNVSKVTNMNRLFNDATVFNQALNNWNVSEVTDMSEMFKATVAFNQTLNEWDVRKVKTMESMFAGAAAFNQPLNNWDVSYVLNMQSMFQNANLFNQPLNDWDVSKVTNMSSMFSSTASFNQPINQWNVSAVTTMANMFASSLAFNQNVNTWNVTKVITMQSMFSNAKMFNQPLNEWDVNSVVNMSSMFQSASAFNQPLNAWDVSAVANTTSMFENAILFNQPLSNWNVSSVTLMKSMFEGATIFNQNLNTWNVGVVTTMEEMFKNAPAFNEPLSNWNTGKVLNMKEMFSGASVFNQNINSWNTSFVRTMEEMFKDARAYNQTMNSWNVASVTTMKGTFQGATAFNGTMDNWNVRRVSTMENMFSGATSFNQTINSWRVNGVTTMNYMFRNATAFNQSLNRWDLGTVTMRSFLDQATSYNHYLGEWNVSRVTDMRDMLDRTALTRTNYDNTLIAWSEQTLTSGVTLGAQGLPYCDAVEERQSMITNFGWTISDDVLDCPIPLCTTLISPLNGATNVPVNTNLNWQPVLYARGYRLTVISNPGNVTVVNNVTVNNATSFQFPTNFAAGATVLVTITPFNDTGNAVGPCIQESFIISNNPATVPACTNLAIPLNAAANVAINSNLSWLPVANADGYQLTVGITSGGNTILNNFNVGNVTTYNLPANLPENTDIFVRIIPYNDLGAATTCTEERFKTELIPIAPECTTLTSPLNGATNVAPDTNVSWNAVLNATGYLISVGTTSGGIEIVNNINVLSATTFNIPNDLLPNRTYYVKIIPYNEVGDALSCSEQSFRTGSGVGAALPICSTITAPLNNAVNVPVNTSISWTAVTNATGYNLSIGTSAGASNLLASTNVGNLTNYNLPTAFPESTSIFVRVVPLNATGTAVGCAEQSFTTQALLPVCTTITAPLDNAINVPVNSSISWTAVTNATGYNLSIGTSAGASNLLASTNVGNLTTYSLLAGFPESTTIFVRVVPVNATGTAVGCTEQSFTTQASLPVCTTITAPLNNAVNVPVNTSISWTAITNATGYKLTLGTTPNGNDILNNESVGNIVSYNLNNNLPFDVVIYVSVIATNSQGHAANCTQQSFTTETRPLAESEYGFSPNGDGINDFWEINGIENSPQNVVNIYNRWGDLVFTISNYNNQSNVFRGEANKLTKIGAGTLPSGTYFFDIQITGTHNLKKLKGFLVLKR